MSNYVVTEFRVGEVLDQGLKVFGRNFVSFLVLGLIYFGVVSLAGVLIGAYVGVEIPEGEVTEVGGGVLLVFAVTFFLTFLMFFLLTATVTYGTYSEMRGQRVGPVACISNGLRLVFPVLGVGIVSTLAIGVGFLLLVIPGLIIMTMLWIAIPVAVVERPGVGASLKRSSELTRGYRMPIFSIILILGLLNTAVNLLLEAIAGVDSVLFAVLGTVIAIGFLMLQSVMLAVGYVHLRSVKEGIGVDERDVVSD